ncbi:MAG: hypothetical protein R3C14_02585 [Caldilineaceae bacterium]
MHSARLAFLQGLHLTAIIGAVVMFGLAFLTAITLRQIGETGEEPPRAIPAAEELAVAAICVQ